MATHTLQCRESSNIRHSMVSCSEWKRHSTKPRLLVALFVQFITLRLTLYNTFWNRGAMKKSHLSPCSDWKYHFTLTYLLLVNYPNYPNYPFSWHWNLKKWQRYVDNSEGKSQILNLLKHVSISRNESSSHRSSIPWVRTSNKAFLTVCPINALRHKNAFI